MELFPATTVLPVSGGGSGGLERTGRKDKKERKCSVCLCHFG